MVFFLATKRKLSSNFTVLIQLDKPWILSRFRQNKATISEWLCAVNLALSSLPNQPLGPILSNDDYRTAGMLIGAI